MLWSSKTTTPTTEKATYNLDILKQSAPSRHSTKSSKISGRSTRARGGGSEITSTEPTYQCSKAQKYLLDTLTDPIERLRDACTATPVDLQGRENHQILAYAAKNSTILLSNLDYIETLLSKDRGAHLEWAWNNPEKESGYISNCQDHLRDSIEEILTSDPTGLDESAFSEALEERISRLTDLTWDLVDPDQTHITRGGKFRGKIKKWGKSKKLGDAKWVHGCAERIEELTQGIELYKTLYGPDETEYDSHQKYDDSHPGSYEEDTDYGVDDENGQLAEYDEQGPGNRRESRYHSRSRGNRPSYEESGLQYPSETIRPKRNVLRKRMPSDLIRSSLQQLQPTFTTPHEMPTYSQAQYTNPQYSAPPPTYHPMTVQSFPPQPPPIHFPPPPMYPSQQVYQLPPQSQTIPTVSQQQQVWDHQRQQYVIVSTGPTWSQSATKAWDTTTRFAEDAAELMIGTGILGGMGYGCWRLGKWYFTGSRADIITPEIGG